MRTFLHYYWWWGAEGANAAPVNRIECTQTLTKFWKLAARTKYDPFWIFVFIFLATDAFATAIFSLKKTKGEVTIPRVGISYILYKKYSSPCRSSVSLHYGTDELGFYTRIFDCLFTVRMEWITICYNQINLDVVRRRNHICREESQWCIDIFDNTHLRQAAQTISHIFFVRLSISILLRCGTMAAKTSKTWAFYLIRVAGHRIPFSISIVGPFSNSMRQFLFNIPYSVHHRSEITYTHTHTYNAHDT